MGNGKSVNYPKPSNSIAVLKRALESTRARTSRIPANSDEFVRVWAGLYRLKDHKSAFAEFAEQELMPEAERDPDDPMGEEAVNVAE